MCLQAETTMFSDRNGRIIMAKDYKKMLQQAGFRAQDSTEQDEQKKKSGAKDYAEMLRKAGFGANGSVQKDDGLDDAQRAARERMIALKKYENDQWNYTNGSGLNKNGLDKSQQAARDRMVWARKPEVQQHLQARANELQNTLPKSLSNKQVEQKGALEYVSEKGDEALYNAVQSRNQTMEAVSQALLGFFEGMSSKKKAKFKTYSPSIEEDTPKRELTRATEKFTRAMKNANDRMTDTMEYNRVNYPPVSTTDTAPEYENVRNNPVARFAGDANAIMAGMIPRYMSAMTASGIGVSGLPGIAGGMTSAAQTFQNAYNEARNDGADEQSATLFAAANASTDAIIESFTGGVLEGGAGIADSVVQKYAGNALNNFFRSRPMMQTLSYVAAKGVGEGTEEVLQDLAKTGAKKLIYGSDEKLDPKSLVYSGLLGFAMGSAFSAMEAPARYAVYKSDYNTVNTLSRGAGEVKSNADADAMEATADAIIDAADKAIDELQNAKPSEDVDTKEEISRLNYVKDGAQKVKDALNENRADIIEQNVAKEDATQNAVDGTPDTIVDDTAKLVNTVADTIEPDKNAVNATIDHVVQEIRNTDVQENVAQTDVEKQEIAAKRSRLEEIDKTLRNNRQEVENARKDTKNQSDVSETGTKKTVREPIPPVYHEGKGVVQYFVPGRKTPVATSSQSDLNVLKLFGGNTTIKQAYDTPLMSMGNVKNILDAYISRGYGDVTLHDMFGFTGKNEFEANQNMPVQRNGSTENGNASTVEKTPETNVQTEPKKPLTENTPDVTMEQAEAAKPEEQSVQTEDTAKPETDVKKTGQFIVDGKIVELDTAQRAPTTKEFSLTHVVKKHTKTGEDMDVFQIPKNLSDKEYSALKRKMKDVDGYYSSFVRGFIVPRDKAGSVSDFANIVEAAPAPKNDAETAIGSLDKGDKLPNSGVTLAKDADKYADDHQRVMEEYANAVDKDFLDYLSVEVKNPGIQAKPYTVARMSDKTAGMIKEKIGLDTTGWDVKIEPRMVDHIWKRHGENGEQDHSMADVSDIARIAYVLNDPDTLDETDKSKAYRENHPYLEGKTRAARSVLITKKVNGTYYVVEAVPNSNRNAAFIVSAYMNKKGVISTTDNSLVPPAQTSAGNDVNTLSENQTPATIPDHSNTSIAEKTENVNTKSPSSEISNYVLNQLSEGKKFTSQELQEAANKAYGGTMAEGKYDVKAMTDAMELGVNRYIIDTVSKAQSDFNAPEAKKAVESIDEITSDILSMIPTQTKRSEEQISLQQFSTPPNIAYLASWVANIDKSDTALEPSAGIGGLASFAKADGAKVYVNELSESRLDMLKQLPFDGFFKENAEQIHNILPDSVSPSVVLMNPPFSSTGGRTKNSTKNAIPHIEQALLRLQDGGRLVAIVGKGMADDTPTFRNWYNELRDTYDIRANVGINGENYRKYGTTFDVQMLVIDKTGPQKGKTITGNYDDLREIPSLLEEVRNDRNRKDQQLGTGTDNKTDNGAVVNETRPETDISDRLSEGISGTNSDVGSRKPGRSNGVSKPVSDSEQSSGTDIDTAKQAGDLRSDDLRNADGLENEHGVRNNAVETGKDTAGKELDERVQDGSPKLEEVREETARREPVETKHSRNVGTDGQSDGNTLLNQKEKQSPKKVAKKDNGIFAGYTPTKLTVKNAKSHPADIVESSAMSAVSAPVLTYKPNIPQELIDSGKLSDIQLESISYAGQAFEQKLPNGQRKGFFIGDGTGVGKGRQIAGVILDNFNHGGKKALWISQASGLVEDARRDWKGLGGDAGDVLQYDDVKKKKAGLGAYDKGILFTTYNMLGAPTGEKHLKAITDWLGKDFDGVIVFDEAHNMSNIAPTKGARGKKDPAKRAQRGVELQRMLPNARVLYASATGATNVNNLLYAERLGLWGEGTQFVDAQDFVAKISKSGIAAMELVARDMKGMGDYLARSISYDGVEFDRLTHNLTQDQLYMYDTMCEAWQVILQNVEKAIGDTKSPKNASSAFWGSLQRFYESIITSFAVPSVIEDMEKELAAGHSCVIQLVNTREAAQNRAVDKLRESGSEDYDDLDLTPRETIEQFLINSFPVEQFEEYIDADGNTSKRAVVDSSGNPVINKKALAARDELIEKLKDIRIPDSPIDMIINHFGVENVSEITNRKVRFVDQKDEKGNVKKVKVERNTDIAKISEAQDFNDGKTRILIFSKAGGTGMSYHADKNFKNQQQRVGYILQAGYNPETAIQGIGRINRSNQTSKPVFKLVQTDISAQKRFFTSIARRIEQMGALTRGQRQAGSGLFSADDNLESDLSQSALEAFYKKLGTGKIPGLKAEEIFSKMGMKKYFYDEYGNFSPNKAYLTDIPKFLNRIMALDVSTGNKAFDAFMEIRDSYYETAREAGTLDTGMENVKADKVDIENDSTVYTDPSTGAETRYIQAKVYNKPTVIKTLEDAKAYKPNFQGIVRMEDGSVRAVYRIADQTNAMGIVQKRYRLQGASGSVVNTMNEKNLETRTEKVPETEWKDAWKEAVKSVPEYDESELHMITGALLPIWNKLPTEGTTKAMRITASDGTQYLGRIIPPKQIDAVLRGLGVKGASVKKEYSGTDLYSAIMDKAQVAVFNGMYGGTLTVARRRVSGENRLEVSGGNLFSLKNKYPGVFSETIQYKTRYFIPSGDRGKEILADMARNYGVRSLGQADDESNVFFSKVQSTWGSRDGKDGKLPKMKSVSDLYKEAKSIFGVEINTGKIGSANAEGIYNTHANTIRTRVYGDLPTIAHELGHMFDKKYNLNEAAEVDKLVEHYRSDLEEAGYNESLFKNEAIAMYFADMFRNSETAQQENPEFSRYLFETLSNEDRNKLGDYKQMTAQYYAADDRTRRGAQIHYRHKDNSAIGKAKFQVDLFSKNPRSYMNILGRQFVHYFIDDVASIGSAVGKENSRNALNLARRQRMADSIAAGRLKYAFTDNNGDVIGQSLQAVLSEGGINDKNARDFDAYLVARVALDRLETNQNDKSVKTLVYADKSLGSMSALVDAIEEYERLNPTFHDAAEGVYEYKNNLLRIAVESGIIKEELAEHLKSTFPHYVPLYRVMDRDKPSYSGRGKKTPHSPIARFKGSGRDVYSPIENLIVQTVNFTKAIQQNEARKALFDVVDQKEDMGLWAEKVPESKVFDMIPTTDVSDKIKAFLTNDDLYTENLSDEQLGELYEDIMSYVGQYTGTWKRKQNQGDTVVSVMRNGSPHYYEIHDEVLLQDLEALAPKQRNVVVNAFAVVTRTMSTLTTTVSPRFNLFTNPIRDAVNGYIFSKTTANPVKYATDLASAFFDAIRESDDFKLYLARGGGYTGSVTSNMNVMRNMHQHLIQRTGFHPIAWFSDFLPDVSNAIESAPRYAEYKRSLAKGESNVEAIQKANEITVDFKQGGSATKYTNNFVMFFNAQITSIIQNFKRLKDKKTLAKWLAANLLAAASWAVLGNLIYDALGIDKEEADDAYAQMSPYNKFSNEILYIGDGQFIRIPKDTSTMILNTLAKAMWEKEVLGNENAFRGMSGYLLDTFLPFWGAWNDISIFGTAFDLKENKTFTGAPIVPTAYQKQNPEMQYNEKTSAFSIRLGSWLGLSPMQIDYVIDDTMGYIGDLYLNLTKQGGPDWKSVFDVQKTSEKSILKGLPVPGVSLRDSVYSTDIVNVFYDTKDKYNKAESGYKAGGEKYTFYDTYGSYKYNKIADVYTKVNKQIKATSDEALKRDLRAELNAILNSVNNTEKTKLDERIAELAQQAGCSASDIAPYITIPEDVKTKNANGEKVTYVLSGYNMIDYFNASQVMLPLYCENIMNADATPEEKADALKKLKKEVKKYLDEQFAEYMSGR
nr:MAG TPA: Type I restriction enzyme Methylase [Caudoviricetes sp.]